MYISIEIGRILKEDFAGDCCSRLRKPEAEGGRYPVNYGGLCGKKKGLDPKLFHLSSSLLLLPSNPSQMPSRDREKFQISSPKSRPSAVLSPISTFSNHCNPSVGCNHRRTFAASTDEPSPIPEIPKSRIPCGPSPLLVLRAQTSGGIPCDSSSTSASPADHLLLRFISFPAVHLRVFIEIFGDSAVLNQYGYFDSIGAFLFQGFAGQIVFDSFKQVLIHPDFSNSNSCKGLLGRSNLIHLNSFESKSGQMEEAGTNGRSPGQMEVPGTNGQIKS
ncbi:hypothetical protein LXL04_035715 [Taraxacum kok-saghyz]